MTTNLTINNLIQNNQGHYLIPTYTTAKEVILRDPHINPPTDIPSVNCREHLVSGDHTTTSFDFVPVLASERTPIVDLIDKLAKALFKTETFAHLSIKEVAKACQKHKIKWVNETHKVSFLDEELRRHWEQYQRILTATVNVQFTPQFTDTKRGSMLFLNMEPYNPYHHGLIVSQEQMEALSHATT